MPLSVASGAPSLIIHRSAYERSGLVRAGVDARLGLTADEFRVEGEIVVIGPVYDSEAFGSLLSELEDLGLKFYDDFFELSGNWPEWLTVFAGSAGADGRNSPSHPQR
jgi:hypothetical protein